MDKGLIVSYLLEIAIAVCCILASIPLWKSLNIEEYEKIAKLYENYGVRVNSTTTAMN